jgi:hypothetical protein
MKKLLTILFAGLISTSLLMAQTEPVKTEKETKKPAKVTKTHKAKKDTTKAAAEKEKK